MPNQPEFLQHECDEMSDEREMTRDDVLRDTASHIRRVGTLLVDCANQLSIRAVNHDASKWSEQEWPAFEKATPKLKSLTYGSEEYKKSVRELGPALEHHHKTNPHHPEHYALGMQDMTLFDLIEMLCDWKAAGERHTDGSMYKSLLHNQGRFNMDMALLRVLSNTARSLGWISISEQHDLLRQMREKTAPV